eukprot:gene16894-19255_t
MALSNMKTKLTLGKYGTLEEFGEDIHLIVENCKLYNAGNTFYTEQAERLQSGWKIFYSMAVPLWKRDIGTRNSTTAQVGKKTWSSEELELSDGSYERTIYNTTRSCKSNNNINTRLDKITQHSMEDTFTYIPLPKKGRHETHTTDKVAFSSLANASTVVTTTATVKGRVTTVGPVSSPPSPTYIRVSAKAKLTHAHSAFPVHMDTTGERLDDISSRFTCIDLPGRKRKCKGQLEMESNPTIRATEDWNDSAVSSTHHGILDTIPGNDSRTATTITANTARPAVEDASQFFNEVLHSDFQCNDNGSDHHAADILLALQDAPDHANVPKFTNNSSTVTTTTPSRESVTAIEQPTVLSTTTIVNTSVSPTTSTAHTTPSLAAVPLDTQVEILKFLTQHGDAAYKEKAMGELLALATKR